MKFRDFHPNIRIRIIIQFFSGLMSVMVLPLMAIYFAERIGATLTGILLFTTVVIGVISGFLGGYYADRIGRKKLMVLAEVGIMVCYAVAALCNSPLFHSVWLTYVAILGINVFWGIFGPSSDAMVLDVSKPEERKYIYSIQYWSNNLALYGFNYRGAWMLSSLAVVVGGVFPPAVMAVLVFACGMIGLVQLFAINGELKKRRATAE